jgi:hypothetical protein
MLLKTFETNEPSFTIHMMTSKLVRGWAAQFYIFLAVRRLETLEFPMPVEGSLSCGFASCYVYTYTIPQ